MKIAIIQSSYLAWKGYFDIIDDVDHFVLLDDVQYSRRDWRARNRISTAQGEKWLSIPLWNKGRYDWKICEMETKDDAWRRSHYDSLKQAYGRQPFWKNYDVGDLYKYAPSLLSEINWMFMERICLWLGIRTQFSWSMPLNIEGVKTDRLLKICQHYKADCYLSGPSAKGYLDVDKLARHGIRTEWKEYDYEPYPGMKTHYVSVLDMLYKVGWDRRYWKCLKR